MLKKITKKIFGGGTGVGTPDGFFLDVRCSTCGEEFHLFINKSTDLLQNFDERDTVTYTLIKEIIGSRCRNLISVRMEFDGAKKLLTKEIKHGEFIEGA